MKYSLLLAGLCFAMLACNQYNPQENDKNQSADSIISISGSSSAAVENNNDTTHAFIRSADLKFKVYNVENTTYKIEDIVSSHDGYVTLTQLHSTIDNELTTAISPDSSLETTSFTITNNMVVRVPNTKLDTTLKDISKLVNYLDYRIIKADDISLQLHANRLVQKRGNQHAARLTNAINNQGKKLSEITIAEEQLQNKQAEADEALLADMSLTNQVKFSTVQLFIYQRQAIRRELIANHKNIDAYEPGFVKKVLNSLQYGLGILEDIFIGLLQLWPLFLLGLIGVLMYRKYWLGFKKK